MAGVVPRLDTDARRQMRNVDENDGAVRGPFGDFLVESRDHRERRGGLHPVVAAKQRFERRGDRLYEQRRGDRRAQASTVRRNFAKAASTFSRAASREFAGWSRPSTRASLTKRAMSRRAARAALDGSSASTRAPLNAPAKVSTMSRCLSADPAIAGARSDSVPSPNTPSRRALNGAGAPLGHDPRRQGARGASVGSRRAHDWRG